MSLCLDLERQATALLPSAGYDDFGDGGDQSILLVTGGSLPMLRHRCRNDRIQADEVLGELSIVQAEFAGPVSPTHRGGWPI